MMPTFKLAAATLFIIGLAVAANYLPTKSILSTDDSLRHSINPWGAWSFSSQASNPSKNDSSKPEASNQEQVKGAAVRTDSQQTATVRTESQQAYENCSVFGEVVSVFAGKCAELQRYENEHSCNVNGQTISATSPDQCTSMIKNSQEIASFHQAPKCSPISIPSGSLGEYVLSEVPSNQVLNVSYNWSGPGTFDSPTRQNPMWHAPSNGSFTVTVTATNPAGSCQIATNINVSDWSNPNPVISAPSSNSPAYSQPGAYNPYQSCIVANDPNAWNSSPYYPFIGWVTVAGANGQPYLCPHY